MKVTLTYEIADEMISDLLTTAFEGGSNHWIGSVTPLDFPEGAEYASDVVAESGTVVVSEWTPEDSTGIDHTLTRDKMLVGIKRACEHYNMTPIELHEQHDAGMADVVLQFALLGEIVYG